MLGGLIISLGYVIIALFTYCFGQYDPVNNVDEDGNLSRIAIGAIAGGIVGGIVGGIKAYSKHGKNWKKISQGLVWKKSLCKFTMRIFRFCESDFC